VLRWFHFHFEGIPFPFWEILFLFGRGSISVFKVAPQKRISIDSSDRIDRTHYESQPGLIHLIKPASSTHHDNHNQFIQYDQDRQLIATMTIDLFNKISSIKQ
jgi:hypothetical protein